MLNPKTNAKDTIVLLLVEGETEEYFYKKLIAHIREKNTKPFLCKIDFVNLKGVGNYKNDSLRRFERLQQANPDKTIDVVLCYDTDVFELSKKPPLDFNAIEKVLKTHGANKIIKIKAKSSIEDWFILDWEGVLKHLRLPKSTPKVAGKGQEILKAVFKKANKVYVKGGRNEGFINSLNIDTIQNGVCPEIKPLCSLLQINCGLVCSCKKNQNLLRSKQ